MTTRITATHLSRNLSEILSRVAYRGESFLIERNGDAVCLLVTPATAAPTLRDLMIALEGKLTHDDSFADDLERVQREQGDATIHDWPS